MNCLLTELDIKGVIFNIQRYTIHDGPGIRTEVFFKGCPLRCKWCSNPESLNTEREVGVYSERCIGFDKCGYCVAVCPEPETILIQDNTVWQVDREKCTGCLKCAESCPANALISWGRNMSVAEVMAIIEADRDFYEKSGGGVTLSGGDVLMQWEFALQLLKQCKKSGIHTCLESSLHYRSEVLDFIYPFVDLIITDIKHMNADIHKTYTGAGNELVLDNIKKTVAMNKPLILRVPIVPGVNDSEENVRATAEFIVNDLQNRMLQVQLLPYRPLGEEKYHSLGMVYPMQDANSVERKIREEKILYLADIMQAYGVPAQAGTTNRI
ncbi:glycyl-radical enzyme activating protein [Dehalobacter sp. DCM]|uniref:glycyl-radical enzyme activating protein n=1 Tax=Dehalobacter sp. DCM TaxID=2907827 RepID=UPI003081FDEF|nr:glycyl-radical enzyme activating protein [Dehalobacter sp. DCM]